MAVFVALAEPAPKGGYGIYFPDLPGCISFAETLEELHRNAREALALHLEGMIEDGEPVPEPSVPSLETIKVPKGGAPWLVETPALGRVRGRDD